MTPTESDEVVKKNLDLIEPGVYFAKIGKVSVWLFPDKKQIRVVDEDEEISFTRSLLPRGITKDRKSGVFMIYDWEGASVAGPCLEDADIWARETSEKKPFIVTLPGVAVQRFRDWETKILWLSDPTFKAEFYCPINYNIIETLGWIPKDPLWGVFRE